MPLPAAKRKPVITASYDHLKSSAALLLWRWPTLREAGAQRASARPGARGDSAQLFIMGPHTDYFYYLFILYNFIDQPVLNIYAPGVGAG
jgi:hypothetical protein